MEPTGTVTAALGALTLGGVLDNAAVLVAAVAGILLIPLGLGWGKKLTNFVFAKIKRA